MVFCSSFGFGRLFVFWMFKDLEVFFFNKCVLDVLFVCAWVFVLDFSSHTSRAKGKRHFIF